MLPSFPPGIKAAEAAIVGKQESDLLAFLPPPPTMARQLSSGSTVIWNKSITKVSHCSIIYQDVLEQMREFTTRGNVYKPPYIYMVYILDYIIFCRSRIKNIAWLACNQMGPNRKSYYYWRKRCTQATNGLKKPIRPLHSQQADPWRGNRLQDNFVISILRQNILCVSDLPWKIWPMAACENDSSSLVRR